MVKMTGETNEESMASERALQNYKRCKEWDCIKLMCK